jgi:hypothetical protein
MSGKSARSSLISANFRISWGNSMTYWSSKAAGAKRTRQLRPLIETRSRAEAEYRRTLLDAENKVDPFNFTRYGLLHGRVTSVSRDAIARNREEQPSLGCDDRGAQSATSEPNGQELVYTARAVLDRTHMDIEGAPVQLLPGMAVTVEIRTGSRRIISYLLSPLIRYRQEVLQER